MISTNIDGSVAGSNDMANLLTLMSDPKGYATKLAELQEATAENRKYVELVGPASEIVRLRTQISDDREAASAALLAAKKEAEDILIAAKDDAASIKTATALEAASVRDEAKRVNAEAKKLKASLTSAIAEAKASKDEAEQATSAANARVGEIEAAKAVLEAATVAADARRLDIIERHKLFIESL